MSSFQDFYLRGNEVKTISFTGNLSKIICWTGDSHVYSSIYEFRRFLISVRVNGVELFCIPYRSLALYTQLLRMKYLHVNNANIESYTLDYAQDVQGGLRCMICDFDFLHYYGDVEISFFCNNSFNPDYSNYHRIAVLTDSTNHSDDYTNRFIIEEDLTVNSQYLFTGDMMVYLSPKYHETRYCVQFNVNNFFDCQKELMSLQDNSVDMYSGTRSDAKASFFVTDTGECRILTPNIAEYYYELYSFIYLKSLNI
jgi:hypothetical protein